MYDKNRKLNQLSATTKLKIENNGILENVGKNNEYHFLLNMLSISIQFTSTVILFAWIIQWKYETK